MLGGAIALCALGDASAEKRVRVVDEGGLRDAWTLAEGAVLAAPGYPAEFAGRGDNVCLAIGYAVRPDGTTSDFSLLKAWNSASGDQEPVAGYWDSFAQAGAAALSEWRFRPLRDRPAAAPHAHRGRARAEGGAGDGRGGRPQSAVAAPRENQRRLISGAAPSPAARAR